MRLLQNNAMILMSIFIEFLLVLIIEQRYVIHR